MFSFPTEARLGAPLRPPVPTPASAEREVPSLCSTLVLLPLFHVLWELETHPQICPSGLYDA